MYNQARSPRGVLAAVALAVIAGLPVFTAGAASLDNYKCYKATDLKSPKFVTTTLASLDDQFETENGVLVKKPFLLCNPTSKDGEGVQNASDHLLCYKVKPSKLEPRPRVQVVNQLGTHQLEVNKSFVVCVPSTKTVLPAPSAGEFVALSYNVAGLPQGLSGSNPETNTPLIAPLLNAYGLVLMQESWKTPDPNPLAPLRVYHEILEAASTQTFKSVSAPLPLGTDPLRPSALVSDGLNRFSRFRFDDVTREPWTNCHMTSADCLALKGFSFSRTTLPGGAVVDVYNLHMEAGGAPEDDALRDAAVTQMSTFINAHSAGRAVIMGGDFNLHTDSEPDSTQFQRLLSETGLVDVCAFLGCPQPGRIDKFLFRSSASLTLTPTSWKFETDVFVDGMGGPLSDHDPLAVNFAWANSGS